MDNKFFIFLDIDGVLNDQNYSLKCYKRHYVKGIMSCQNIPFNPKSLNNLMKLYQYIKKKEYKPIIVLSSTWRLNNIDIAIINARLAEYGMSIREKTSTGPDRGLEIVTYLTDNAKENDKYIILDDETFDFSEMGIIDHLIQTSFVKGGFNRRAFKKALKYINNLIN